MQAKETSSTRWRLRRDPPRQLPQHQHAGSPSARSLSRITLARHHSFDPFKGESSMLVFSYPAETVLSMNNSKNRIFLGL